MSKTVIVFSTRFIGPLHQNCLFSNCTRKTFTSKSLANFFWDDIKQNKEYLKSLLTDNYFINEKKQALVEFLVSHKDELKRFISNNSLEHSFSTTDFNWIGFITNNPEFRLPLEEQRKLKELYMDYNKSIDDTSQLSNTDSLDLCNALKTDTYQRPFNLGVEDDGKSPWLYYRFSYYELNPANDSVKVYAVWPLQFHSPQQDRKYQWVEALTDQFLSDKLDNNDATELYLILHDDDIKNHTPFEVIIDDTAKNAARHVALFQHDNIDEIGRFIKRVPNNSSPEEVKSYVEKMVMEARKRKLLRDAYDFFKYHKSDQLLDATKKLYQLDKERFKDIYVDALVLSNPGGMTIQYIDKFKLSFIGHLNKEIRDLMIV